MRSSKRSKLDTVWAHRRARVLSARISSSSPIRLGTRKRKQASLQTSPPIQHGALHTGVLLRKRRKHKERGFLPESGRGSCHLGHRYRKKQQKQKAMVPRAKGRGSQGAVKVENGGCGAWQGQGSEGRRATAQQGSLERSSHPRSVLNRWYLAIHVAWTKRDTGALSSTTLGAQGLP